MKPEWFPDWSGDACLVVASGESAGDVDLDQFRGRVRVLVINNGFRLVPWADALYAADARWWICNAGAVHFAGLKVTADAATAKRLTINRVHVAPETDPDAHQLKCDQPGRIGHGGNSGFQGLNVALQFGARYLGLVGFDCRGGHWHEKHAQPMINPRPQTLEKWRVRLDAQARFIDRAGAHVVNLSATSALTAFRKIGADEFLQRRAA